MGKVPNELANTCATHLRAPYSVCVCVCSISILVGKHMNMTLLVAALIRAIYFRVHSDKYSLSLSLFFSLPLCRHLLPHNSIQLQILGKIPSPHIYFHNTKCIAYFPALNAIANC